MAQLELIAELKNLEALEAEAVALKASRAPVASPPRALVGGRAAVAPARGLRPVVFMPRHGAA